MFTIHQLHPPNQKGSGYNLGCSRLHESFRRDLEPSRNSVWICSPYLNREAFEWAEQFGPRTVYLITSANKRRELSNDPKDNPENIKCWVEVLAAHTHNPIYMCVYPFDRKEKAEPLLHSKLYLDIEFTGVDPAGNLSDLRFEEEPSVKIFAAFCGSMNFTRTGLGLKQDFTFPEGGMPTPDWSAGRKEQNFEILLEANDEDAKIALAKAFCFLWNRGARHRYKYCTSEGWTPALATQGNES